MAAKNGSRCRLLAPNSDIRLLSFCDRLHAFPGGHHRQGPLMLTVINYRHWVTI
jgi:hypothetical protein